MIIMRQCINLPTTVNLDLLASLIATMASAYRAMIGAAPTTKEFDHA